ncbi:helix-turn-helix domain-containing protein [Pararhizobium sp. PWRC1-1]|uniref:helix-turn-helix domain-containing protein n=1 Tax=Pararhizobium sp. PWRC1-1 TaxID=2804566 RepID=UPI003CF284C2
MLFVPLPFVVAVLLVVLFVIVLKRDEGAPPNVPFLALILLSAFQSLLSGLRWGYAVESVMYIMPVLAAAVPPLAYTGVAGLVRESSMSLRMQIGLHAIPSLVIVMLVAVWRDAIDAILVLIFVGYAVAILRLMQAGTDALRLAPFDGAAPAYRAILFAAFALLLSASVDTLIALDLAWTHGEYTRPVITTGNLAALAVLSIAAAAASRSHSPMGTPDADLKPQLAEDKETMADIQALMETKRVYRDADLNLDRLARKLGIPARQISTAINRATGKNVSQYVNEHRIAEACSQLVTTERPVTEIMFEVGFQTKSNFNREFRRVTDMTPLEWRERNAKPTSIAIEYGRKRV